MRLMDVIVAKARGEYLRTHFKNMREVAAALSGEFWLKWNLIESIILSGFKRHELEEGVHLPRRRSGPQAGYSFPTVRWRYWPSFSGQAVQDYQGCVEVLISIAWGVSYTRCRSMARKVCQVHPPSPQERRVQRRG